MVTTRPILALISWMVHPNCFYDGLRTRLIITFYWSPQMNGSHCTEKHQTAGYFLSWGFLVHEHHPSGFLHGPGQSILVSELCSQVVNSTWTTCKQTNTLYASIQIRTKNILVMSSWDWNISLSIKTLIYNQRRRRINYIKFKRSYLDKLISIVISGFEIT